MSITMKLDAPAVRALIGDNEQFRLELQAAIIQEVVRGLYDKSIPGQLRDVISSSFAERKGELVEALRDNASAAKAVDEAMKALILSERSTSGRLLYTRTLSTEAKDTINRHVSALLTTAVDDRMVEVNKVIGDVVERFRQRAEDRMENALARFDQEYHDLCTKAVMEKFVSFATK